jgi:CyaY protein
VLDESTYNNLVTGVFKRLLAAADAADPDVLEADSTGDMVTFTATKTGEKVVVNTQRAVRQIWVAGKGSGIHFSLMPEGRWMDDKGKGLELIAWIAECVRAMSGVDLAA